MQLYEKSKQALHYLTTLREREEREKRKEIKRRREITSPGSSAKPANGELHVE